MRRLRLAALPAALLLSGVLPAAAEPAPPSPAAPEPSEFLALLSDASPEEVEDLDHWLDAYLRTGLLEAPPAEGLPLSLRAHRELERAQSRLQETQSRVEDARSALRRAQSTRAARSSELALLHRRHAAAADRVQDLLLTLAADTASAATDTTVRHLLQEQLVVALVEEQELAAAVSAAVSRADAAERHLQVSEAEVTDRLAGRTDAAGRFSLLLQQLRAASAGRVDLLWMEATPSGCPLYAPADTLRILPDRPASRSAPSPSPDEGSSGEGTVGLPPDAAGSEPLPEEAAEHGLTPVLELCERSAALAPTPEAAAAVRYAFRVLGAPYACDGTGRSQVFRFDCSSFVSRAYWEGAGVPVASAVWAPSTRDMVPWDGHQLASWLTPIGVEEALPGDLVLFDTGLRDSRHVVMLLADGLMVHTSTCGDVLHITRSWLESGREGALLLGARRVVPERAGEISSWYGSPLDDAPDPAVEILSPPS